jgi:hypothetical protein
MPGRVAVMRSNSDEIGKVVTLQVLVAVSRRP